MLITVQLDLKCGSVHRVAFNSLLVVVSVNMLNGSLEDGNALSGASSHHSGQVFIPVNKVVHVNLQKVVALSGIFLQLLSVGVGMIISMTLYKVDKLEFGLGRVVIVLIVLVLLLVLHETLVSVEYLLSFHCSMYDSLIVCMYVVE